MWFKQAASSVWNATKNILADQRSPARRIVDDIVHSEEEVIPTNKLNELAALTYNLESFQQIVDLTIERIRVFKYDLGEARCTLNMLITVNYLVKHGAGAFVDELRQYIPTFQKYQTLQELHTYEDENLQNSLNYELEKIKSRAKHIQTLLEDKQKLLKEKELSMLVKQKLKIYQQDKQTQSPQKAGQPGQQKLNEQEQLRMSKLEWMMEKYLWQYVDKIDGKIEEVSDKVLQQVDKYVLGEAPEKFELQDEENAEENSPNKDPHYQSLNNDNDDDLMKRLEAEIQEGGAVDNNNLLDFEEVIDEPPAKAHPKQVQNDDLI